MAWLLATTRMLGPNTRGLPRADFVAPMRELGIRIDSSRISRWESGLEYLSPRLVAAYEQVAGLPPEHLGVVRRAVARDGQLMDRHAKKPEPPDPVRIDEILDRVDAGEVHGHEWLWLADQLHAYDNVYLPRRTWESLATHLVDELARAATTPYLARYEATVTLLNARQAQPHLTKSVGRFVLDPDAAVITPVLAVLSEMSDPAACDLVLRLLQSPSGKLRNSAAIVAAAMIGREHLDPDDHVIEVHVGHELKAAAGVPSSVTLDLASRLTDARFERVLHATTDEAARAALRQARANHELIDPEEARTLADHIGMHAELLSSRKSPDPDQMLRRLVREALCHVHRRRRHLAAAMLLASPYAHSVAEVALGLTAHDDERLANLCWSLVGRMASALSAHALAEQLLTERRPRLRTRAASTLMWVTDTLPEDAVEVLARAAVDTSETQQTASAAVLALGLAGRTDRLADIADAMPRQVGALAQWAIERGPAVKDQNHAGPLVTPTEPQPNRDRTAPDWR
ncbi:hypothetical protein [Nocardioides panacisoli]